jgi:hypothetical protein
MTAAEQMYQAVGRDRLGAEGGGAIERVALFVEQISQTGQSGTLEMFRR